TQDFPSVVDPFTVTNPPAFKTQDQVEERIAGNPFLHPEVAYEWTYGAVYSPKWIKGMTLSADWWHIDMRDIVASLGAQFIIQNSNRAPVDALDTWAGGLDVGAVVHWTGQFEDDNFDLTLASKPQEPRSGGLPNRARKVAAWTTLDLILNYTFNLPPPAAAEVPGFAKDGGKNVKTHDGKEKNVVPVSTAEYGCSNWKWWLNNTTLTLGMQNVTDEDPPFVAGNFE